VTLGTGGHVLMDERPSKVETIRRPIRVLLLDDLAENLLLRSTILRKHGYEAITSSSVEEAEYKRHDIDIAEDG